MVIPRTGCGGHDDDQLDDGDDHEDYVQDCVHLDRNR